MSVLSSGSLGSSFTFLSQFKRELALSITLPSLHSPNSKSWWSHLFLVWLSIVSFVIFRKTGGGWHYHICMTWGNGLSPVHTLTKAEHTFMSESTMQRRKRKLRFTNHLGQSSEVRWLLGNQCSGKGTWQSKPIFTLGISWISTHYLPVHGNSLAIK